MELIGKPGNLRIAIRCLPTVCLLAALAAAPGSGFAITGAKDSPVNAMYLLNPPDDYESFRDAVRNFNGSGAEVLVVRPVTEAGRIDRVMLAKAVFFAHSAGLKLFAVLPTRSLIFPLREHPEWEDRYFDLESGTLEPSGKLDLFNPYVTVFLSDLFRDIAAYSVDGIILDDDFYYLDTEGITPRSLDRYLTRFGTAFSIRSGLGRLKGKQVRNHALDEYGRDFWNLAELKKESLLLLLQNIVYSTRAVNKNIRIGLSLHVPGLFLKQKELLAWYSHEVRAFKQTGLDFFWLALPHRELRSEQNLNYKMTLQKVSRIALSSISLAGGGSRAIIALQAVADSEAMLPLSEIEDISGQVKKAGEPGIALMVESDTRLPLELTRKIFRGAAH